MTLCGSRMDTPRLTCWPRPHQSGLLPGASEPASGCPGAARSLLHSHRRQHRPRKVTHCPAARQVLRHTSPDTAAPGLELGGDTRKVIILASRVGGQHYKFLCSMKTDKFPAGPRPAATAKFNTNFETPVVTGMFVSDSALRVGAQLGLTGSHGDKTLPPACGEVGPFSWCDSPVCVFLKLTGNVPVSQRTPQVFIRTWPRLRQVALLLPTGVLFPHQSLWF